MHINPIFQKGETQEQIRQFFSEEAFIQLPTFLEEEEAHRLRENLLSVRWEQSLNKTHKREQVATVSSQLRSFLDFFQSTTFTQFLEDITDMDLELEHCEVLQYQEGDFESIQDSLLEQDCIEVIYDLTPEWDVDSGGILTYCSEQDEIFYLTPAYNSLTIIAKPDELYSYLSEISNTDKKKKIQRIRLQFSPIER